MNFQAESIFQYLLKKFLGYSLWCFINIFFLNNCFKIEFCLKKSGIQIIGCITQLYRNYKDYF